MSADRFREAAALLRERAEVEPILRDGDPYYEVTYMPDGTPITEMGAFERVLTPDVAKAFAEWLDHAADDHDAGECPSDCPASRVVDEILDGGR